LLELHGVTKNYFTASIDFEENKENISTESRAVSRNPGCSKASDNTSEEKESITETREVSLHKYN